MRAFIGLFVLLLVGTSQAGLLHRRFRDVQPSESVSSEVRKDQIPVTVIQLKETEILPLQAEIKPAEEIPLIGLKTLAEEVKEEEEKDSPALKATEKLEQVEQKVQQEPVNQEIKEEIQQENLDFLRTVVAAENVHEEKPAVVVEPEIVQQVVAEAQQEAKKLVAEVDPVIPVVVEETVQAVENIETTAEDEKSPTERQATPASPPQQNIVQQIIQNTPIIGPFLSQFTGGNSPPAGVASDEAVTPAPAVPIFQNPGAAISQAASQAQQAATQAVQNVFNSTSQAIQGIQQFASNIGNQVQSTLTSTFGGQPQEAESSSPRPPGPIQSLINNFVGGNNQQAGSTPAPAQQQQGPLQGILNIFQGNRPQGSAAIAPAETAAADVGEPAKQEDINALEVDDKIDVSDNEIKEQENEVRHSEEVVDSFEETRPDDIVVHDDVVEVAV